MSEEFEKIKMIAKTEEKMAEAWKVTYGSEYDRKGQFYKKVMKIIENSESEGIEYGTPEYFEWIGGMTQDEYLRHFKNNKLTVWDYPAKVFEGSFNIGPGWDIELTEEQIENGEKLVINNLEEITGGLRIECPSVHSLGSIKKVGSFAVLFTNKGNLKELPDDFICKKHFYLAGGHFPSDDFSKKGHKCAEENMITGGITEIKGSWKIGGEITISNNTAITKLPEEDFTVNGHFRMINTPNVKRLPKNLVIKGNAEITNCESLEYVDGIKTKSFLEMFTCNNLTKILGKLHIGGRLHIGLNNLVSLPDGIIAKNSFNISYCHKLKNIPNNFTCGKHFNIQHSNIETIGENLIVKGEVYLTAAPIKSVGEGFECGHKVIFKGGDLSVFGNLLEGKNVWK